MTEAPAIDPIFISLQDGLKQLLERRGLNDPALIGIRTGGVWLAHRLQAALKLPGPCGELDITFYRDDFSRVGLHPRVMPSALPFETEDRHIVLIDDVIMSGRTIRAAMNEIFDYGRPASVTLCTLIDLGGRELPIQPDITGAQLSLPPGKRIKLRGPDPLRIELRDLSSS